VSAEALAQAGGFIAATGVALLLVARPSRVRLGGLAVWALGMALFLPLLAPTGHRALLIAAAILAVAVATGLAAVIVRWPWSLPFLTLAAAPARIPVTVGETSANLLLPLYGVIVAGVLALAWTIWRNPQRSRELGPLAWPVALVVLWFSLSELWTKDVRAGAIELFFYLLPLSVLSVALARLPWSERNTARLGGLLLAMALAFAAIGVGQWAARDVFWNAKVIAGNLSSSFFRVNSVFWDPSIYGRFLAVGILTALALLLFGGRRGPLFDLGLVAAIVLMWVGLLFSFSQSSLFALAVGIILVALVAWRWRALAAVAVSAAIMIPVGFASPQLERVRDSFGGSSDHSLRRATSDRSKLVSVGVRIARDHPVLGVGIGGFRSAYGEEQSEATPPKNAVSHTAPVTVAAETGLVGLLLYAWLLLAGLQIAFRKLDVHTPAGRTQAIAGICFAAIAAHSLFYSAFFEDPFTWGFAALAALAARARFEGETALEREPS
jgi:O-antigen ligase